MGFISSSKKEGYLTRHIEISAVKAILVVTRRVYYRVTLCDITAFFYYCIVVASVIHQLIRLYFFFLILRSTRLPSWSFSTCSKSILHFTAMESTGAYKRHYHRLSSHCTETASIDNGHNWIHQWQFDWDKFPPPWPESQVRDLNSGCKQNWKRSSCG